MLCKENRHLRYIIFKFFLIVSRNSYLIGNDGSIMLILNSISFAYNSKNNKINSNLPESTDKEKNR